MRVMVLPCLSKGEVIVCLNVVFVGPAANQASPCGVSEELQKLVAAIRTARSSADQTTSSQA